MSYPYNNTKNDYYRAFAKTFLISPSASHINLPLNLLASIIQFIIDSADGAGDGASNADTCDGDGVDVELLCSFGIAFL